MKKGLALVLALVMALSLVACGSGNNGGGNNNGGNGGNGGNNGGDGGSAGGDGMNISVLYYNYSDAFISNVRNEMDAKWAEMGITANNQDGQTNAGTQLDQVNTAIANGAQALVVNAVEASADETTQAIVDAAKNANIPVIFFNREVSDDVINSYDLAAFVGTDPA